MKTDVLFVIHDVYQEDNQFSLNIGYLAAVLEQNKYSVEIYCMDVYHYTNEELAKKLQDNEYEIIGLGFMAARFKETIIDLCKTINKYKKDARLILGGHGPSPIPDYILEKTKCDAVAVGESENTILEILKDKKNKINKKIYRSEPVRDIDTIPHPAWHFFPMDIYTTNMKLPGMADSDRAFQLISSRGCINICTFCYRMEKGIRLRDISKVVEEMKILNNRYGVTTFQFQDELFLISKKRLKEFRDQLIKNNLKIKFTANARVDIFDEEIAQILKDIDCIVLNIGFESSSQEVLDYMKKNVKVEQNIETLKICKKIGLNSGLNFIWGFPPDTKNHCLIMQS